MKTAFYTVARFGFVHKQTVSKRARTYQGAGEPVAPSSSWLGVRPAYLLRADAG
jgi:hypothetical protein